MANIKVFKGGTPIPNYMWKEGDRALYQGPYAEQRLPYQHVPPYDSHADAAYGLGSFVLGMPIAPFDDSEDGGGSRWMHHALQDAKEGDIVQCIWLPLDNMATYLNFKCAEPDPIMAGASVGLIAQTLSYKVTDGKLEEVWTEDTSLAEAVTAQFGSNDIPWDKPFNVFVSLLKVKDNYAIPMYSKPGLPPATPTGDPVAPEFKFIGFKINAMPTDVNVNLSMSQAIKCLSVRMEAFECPGFY